MSAKAHKSSHLQAGLLPSRSPFGCDSRGVAGSYLQINEEFHTIPEKPEKTCFTGETFFFFFLGSFALIQESPNLQLH